ncbi:MAG: GLUG motif-containing protein [Planctomycetota bacterium]|jgi:hypothetical protein
MSASRNTGLNSHFSPFFSRNYQSKAAFAIMAVICLLVSRADAKYGGGTGEPNNPYRIGTAEDLNDIGNHPEDWNSHFVMVNDVNLADYTGTEFNMIGGDNWTNPFTGVFDGNGHMISNFTYVSTTGFVGIFRYIDDANAVVKDLTLIDPNIITSGAYIGALVGVLHNGTILNCDVQGGCITATVYGTAGGLVGATQNATISDCYATCDVLVAAVEAGGLVGLNHGTISDSYAMGNVTGGHEVGGLVGRNGEDGSISNCFAAGNVEGIENVGGLAGDNSNYGCISNSYSTGNVAGQLRTGGLIGFDEGGEYPVSYCYTTGSIDGNDTTGGLIGRNHSTVSSCYTLGTVSGKDYTGGLIGENQGDLSQCFAMGNVTGEYISGGLVGENQEVVSNSYSAGNVDGNDITGGLFGRNCCNLTVNSYSCGRVTGDEYTTGGFVGDDMTNSYGNCFWDKTINPLVQGAGHPICKYFPQYCPMPDPEGLIGKITAEMQIESTFTDAGWDFVEVWNIGENQTYPFLRVYPTGDLNHDGRVDLFDFGILAGHWLEGVE